MVGDLGMVGDFQLPWRMVGDFQLPQRDNRKTSFSVSAKYQGRRCRFLPFPPSELEQEKRSALSAALFTIIVFRFRCAVRAGGCSARHFMLGNTQSFTSQTGKAYVRALDLSSLCKQKRSQQRSCAMKPPVHLRVACSPLGRRATREKPQIPPRNSYFRVDCFLP